MPKPLDKPDIQQRSFDFAVRVVKLCKELEQNGNVSHTLANQQHRSATSVGDNIEEAQGAQSKPDFTAKMYISCKEARETHYWLKLLIATNIIPEAKLSSLSKEANELVAILTTITKSARAKK